MSRNSKLTVTIITPTYNRAEKLKDLYLSLHKQSSYEFEWIIIDDGSTDDTEAIVNNFVAPLSA